MLLPRINGHRGAAAHAPENTLEGIRKAKELRIDAVELDVALAKDGVAVLFHDQTIERTTGTRPQLNPVIIPVQTGVAHLVERAGQGYVVIRP